MTRVMRRWRMLAVGAAGLAAALPVLVARAGVSRAERTLGERTATAVAGYLATVTRPAGRAYDPQGLIVAARRIGSLPGWSAAIEVYAVRTPLLAAGAGRLPRPAWRAIAGRDATVRIGGGSLVPLKDRDQWDVVGGAWVADRAAPADGGLLATGAWAALAGLGVTWGVGRRRRLAVALLAVFAAASIAHGVAAGAVVRRAAAWSTDRALQDARLLVQDAPVRLPGPPSRVPLAAVARVVQGTGLSVSAADSGDPGVRRVVEAAGPRAITRARLGPGRWVALRAVPLESAGGGWATLAVALGLVGPAAGAVAVWGARAVARPRVFRETLTAWTFLAPAALHLAVFSAGPILFAAWLSLHRWSLVDPVRPFVGVANFAALGDDPLVGLSLRNTAVYALYVPVTMALALIAALALNRPGRLVQWVRTAFFVPYVSSVVAVALVWQWMLNPDFGLLNGALATVGIAPVDWLGDPRTALLAVMLLSVWVQLGYQMTVFLAGLQGIPPAYLDAARVDGAGAWQRFWRVTFPLLRPVVLFVLVTGVIGSFQVFTYVYVLTDGGPLHATDVVVYRIYQVAWEFLQFGYASALALVLFALLLGLTWAQFRLLGRRVEYG
ncbi:MAG TPA: sugar ABC transporter permease [Gemmatimonadales bacterium]|nr:sugar ABC transporter permease [Gemmatimonadales bacterium]